MDSCVLTTDAAGSRMQGLREAQEVWLLRPPASSVCCLSQVRFAAPMLAKEQYPSKPARERCQGGGDI